MAQDQDEVLATLNGEPITRRDLDMTLNDLQDQLGQVPEEGRDAAALTALVDIRALARRAQEEGLDETEDFKSRLEFLRQRALHNANLLPSAQPQQQEDSHIDPDENIRQRTFGHVHETGSAPDKIR